MGKSRMFWTEKNAVPNPGIRSGYDTVESDSAARKTLQSQYLVEIETLFENMLTCFKTNSLIYEHPYRREGRYFRQAVNPR